MQASENNLPIWHGTTILTVRKGGKVVIGGDGQVSIGQTVIKANAKKVRKIGKGDVIGGFAGATADAFTLFERLESKLEQYPGQLTRAAVELAKDWRTDRYLRRQLCARRRPRAGRDRQGRRDHRAPRARYRRRHLRLHQPQRHDRVPLRGAPIMAPDYVFRPMTTGDLPLVRRWLAEPHVVQWWGNTLEQFELVSGDLEIEAMEQFVVAINDRPFGYLQCYDPDVWPENGLGAHPRGTRGIDQFIGEQDMVDRGHGSSFIRTFIGRLLAAGAPRVITDPDPANGRAIRAYEKAGFRRHHLVDTPDGTALLMVRDA